MDVASIIQFITSTFDGLDIVKSSDGVFFFYDPERSLPEDRRFPFATVMTTDAQDQASNLSRPDVFRLNFGLGRETYRLLFGTPPSQLGGPGGVDTGYDYTQLDQLMPHPIYAAMSWACVLNPSDITFDQVRTLLREAYDVAVSKYEKSTGW